eukprot:PhF_6_TR3333/c0_g1_i2/m.4704/K09539/DNAJC19; DnaJ homolog subfamily C member 19
MAWPILLAAAGLFVGYHAVRVAPRVASRYGAMAAASGASSSGVGSQYSFSQYERGGFLPNMTPDEARLILGVSAQSSADEIKKAHRELISKNHTDVGGSELLARKINEARDILE